VEIVWDSTGVLLLSTLLWLVFFVLIDAHITLLLAPHVPSCSPLLRFKFTQILFPHWFPTIPTRFTPIQIIVHNSIRFFVTTHNSASLLYYYYYYTYFTVRITALLLYYFQPI
jgi:hypothetical protein